MSRPPRASSNASSDNGGAGYIGLPEVNEPYRGWKLTFFEGGIHVPFFMRWPAGFAGGTTVANPVHHFDIYATAAAAAGAPLPSDRKVDGVDLLPCIRGERTDNPHPALFWRSGHYQVVRAGPWKLVAKGPGGPWELYHMEEDRTEMNDLASRHPERVAAMVAQWESWARRAQVLPWIWRPG